MNHPDAIKLISSAVNIDTNPPANTGLTDNFKVACSPDDYFKKYIERNSGVFTTFNEGKHWCTWYRNTFATARSQQIAEVSNSDYLAAANDVVNLFREKQKFVHATLDKTLQTDRVKKHAREHENDYDPQSVRQKLISFCTKSTNARISTSNALSHITSEKI